MDWYNIKVIVFILTVLKNNQQKIKTCNTKSKLVNYWLIIKIMRDFLEKNRKEESMKFYQHIYEYKTVLK